jgi:hypothetical protein
MCRINFIANFMQGSEHIATCTNFIEKFKHFHCKFQTVCKMDREIKRAMDLVSRDGASTVASGRRWSGGGTVQDGGGGVEVAPSGRR